MRGRGGRGLVQDQVGPRSASSLRNSTSLWTRVTPDVAVGRAVAFSLSDKADGMFRQGSVFIPVPTEITFARHPSTAAHPAKTNRF